MIRNIEETQMDMNDKLEELLAKPGGGSSGFSYSSSNMDSRISNIERHLTGLSNAVASVSDTLSMMAGQQSGSKQLIDQVAQMNQMAHSKLSFLEDVSRKSHDKAEELHLAFQEKHTSNFWWYMCLVLLQIVIVFWLAMNWKKGDKSSVDKKFI